MKSKGEMNRHRDTCLLQFFFSSIFVFSFKHIDTDDKTMQRDVLMQLKDPVYYSRIILHVYLKLQTYFLQL